VREALRQLVGTGLVESIPRRGAVVTSFGPERLSQLYEAIGELETLCARLAAQRMTAIERKALELALAPLLAAAAAGDRDRYLDCSDVLHDLIHRGCHNPFLIELVRSYRLRSLPFRNLQSYSRERMQHSSDEHRRMVEAIVGHDADEATQVMRGHVASSLLRALATIGGASASQASPPAATRQSRARRPA
jgi:DNA-binding GntR family transcriptional regulator